MNELPCHFLGVTIRNWGESHVMLAAKAMKYVIGYENNSKMNSVMN